jgi:hypothetical protein
MLPVKASAALRQEERTKRTFLQGQFIFEMNCRLTRCITAPADRKLLFRTLRNYVTSKRRGSLRLPKHFPAQVRDLMKLSKTQIREQMYWLKANTSTAFPLNQRNYAFVTQLSAVPIWNRGSQGDFHTANAVGLARLGKRDAPRSAKRLWPSAPSFSEMLEGVRRNVYNCSSSTKYGIRFRAKSSITKQDLSNDIRLATRIVSNNVVGIRSSVRIPEEFLLWFRHRHGFSILSVRSRLPSGLVRFLLAQWVICPTNLWLVEHCPLKIFLRRHSADDFGVTPVATEGPTSPSVSMEDVVSWTGSPTPEAPAVLSLQEIEAELGGEFAEFFSRLPD